MDAQVSAFASRASHPEGRPGAGRVTRPGRRAGRVGEVEVDVDVEMEVEVEERRSCGSGSGLASTRQRIVEEPRHAS